MAFVNNAGARIYWNAIGKGEPLVLLMGLGCSSAMWFRLAPRLARRYRVILIDNRGTGQTEVPYYVVHRVTAMASDVAAVLDAAGLESAHIAGFSMGGMIAQEFALNYPRRVRSLMLMATNVGRSHAVIAADHVARLLFIKGNLSPEEALDAMRPYTYSSTTPDDRIDEDQLVRLASYPPARAYQAQLYGLLGWSSYLRLPKVAVPTLVLHGKEDQLIPPQNGRMIAARIPESVLIEFDAASHWLFTDQTDPVVTAMTGFIRKHRSTAAA